MKSSLHRALIVALLSVQLISGTYAANLTNDGRPLAVLIVPESAPQATGIGMIAFSRRTRSISRPDPMVVSVGCTFRIARNCA